MPPASQVAPPSAVARMGCVWVVASTCSSSAAAMASGCPAADLLQLPRLAAVGGGEHAGVTGDPETGRAGAGDLSASAGRRAGARARRRAACSRSRRRRSWPRRTAAPSWVSQPATQACRESPAATLVSTVMGKLAAQPPGAAAVARRPDPVERHQHAVPLVGEGDVGELGHAEAGALPGRAGVGGPVHGGGPRITGGAERVADDPGVRGVRRGDRLHADLHLLDHGPGGAAVGGREHRAGVGDEPAGLRVGEGDVHAALRQQRSAGASSVAPPSAVTSSVPGSPAAQAWTPGAGAGGSPKGCSGASACPPPPQPATAAAATASSRTASTVVVRSRLGFTSAPGPPASACPRRP